MARRQKQAIANTVQARPIVGPPASRRPTRGGLLSATALAALVGWGVLSFTTPAYAQLPTGGTVVGGTATITTGSNQVTVNQATNRGVIDWRSFSVGQGNRVDFRQPGASSVTLNRVTGPDPSVIAGQLTANGQIVLVNGAGVFFANGAQVNVGSLVASTANIANTADFMAGGKLTFGVPSSNANAGVVNDGSITVRDGGLVGLVGNTVANNGVINARLGRVTIGGAETFTVDLAGDGLINFQIGQPVSRQPVDSQGRKVPLASNTGTINADGGVVTMTARAAGSVVDSVVNVGGAIRAQAVTQENGVLVLGAVNADAGDGGTVNVTGKIDVSGRNMGQRGGQVIATAPGGKVNVASTAVIDASGAFGGGKVNIGGSYQGKGPIANARNTTVESGARINADATMLGNGGTVIVWSDNATVFGGTITAKGGQKGGDGGFVEVSGKSYLDYRGFTDLRAPAGTTGTLLLDPSDITIQVAGPDDISPAGGGPTITGNSAASILTVATLQNALGSANVIVDAAGGTGTALLGTITVAADVSIPNGRTLTLSAPGAINVNAAISTPAGGSANLGLVSTGGAITSGALGTISLGAGTLTLQGTSINLNAAAVTAGTVNFTATAGSVGINNAGNAITIFAGFPSTASGNVTISSTTSVTITTGGISAGGDVTITSGGDVGVIGDIQAGFASGVFITATGNIGVSGAIRSTSTSGIVDLQSTGVGGQIFVTSTGSVSAQQNVTMGATGSIAIAGNVSHTGTTGAVNLNADGADANGVGILLQAGSTISSSATSNSLPGVVLDTTVGSIVQTGGSIIANVLRATSGSSVSLASPTNDVNFIAGSAVTSFRYVDVDDISLGIGSVVVVGSGTVGVAEGITIGAGSYVDIAASQISITQSTGTLPGTATAQIGAMPGVSGGIQPNPTGAVVLRPITAGAAMVIGGTTGTTLTEAVLTAGIAAGTLRIGSIGRAAGTVLGGATTAAESATGTITIQGLNLFGSAVGALVLESGIGSITQTGALAVATLVTGIVGEGSVTLTNGGNSIGAVAHIARISDTALGTQTGVYQFTGGTTVTVGSIGQAPPLVGLRDGFVTSGGSIILTSLSAGTININAPLIAPNTVVNLSDPTGGIFNNAAGTIDVSGGTLNLNAGGTINLSAAPVSAGVVNFVASGGVFLTNSNNAIDMVAATASSAGIFSNINIASASSLTIGPGGITAEGFITIQSAGQVLVIGNVTSTGTSGGMSITSTGALAGVGILQTAGTLSAPTINLNATAGDIVQTGGNIVATGTGFTASLTATASGSVDLSSATNDVVTLVGAAGGDFRYVDANTVSIGQAFTVPIGITIGAGRYLDIAADTINILAGARIGGIATGSPGSSFPADNPTGVTVLRPTTANAPMVVGGASGTTGTLLTQANLLASVQTGTLRLGSIGRAAGLQLGGATTALENPAGLITIQGLDFTGAGQLLQRLVLESGAAGLAIQQTGAIRLTRGGGFEGALATAVRGSGSVELTNPNNSVTGLAHVAVESDSTLATQSGTFRYVDESSIPVVSVAGSGTPLIGARDSGNAPGAAANSAILTNGGDVTLVSRTGSIEFINGLAAIGATARLNAADQIFQSATGGVVVNSLLAVAGGSVDLSTAVGFNDVRFLSGSAAGSFGPLGDFRLINNASVTVQTGGVAGDSLVATVNGVQAGVGATLELAIRTGDITVNNTTLTATDGLILLRRVAGATGSEIILNNVSFDSGSGSPNLVVLDLTGSPVLVPGSFAGLKSSSTPPNGTSAIPIGPNPDGGILLNNVNAGNTTVYLVGGAGSTIAGSGTYGLLGVYVAHSNPIALTGSVRQIDPTTSHSVTAPFSEPFDSTTFAGFYVRRRGAVVDLQTFNTCPIGSGICPAPEIPPRVQRPPDDAGRLVGTPDLLIVDFATDFPSPTPLGLTTIILVNQGNEYFFNVDEERRKQRAARGGQ